MVFFCYGISVVLFDIKMDFQGSQYYVVFIESSSLMQHRFIRDSFISCNTSRTKTCSSWRGDYDQCFKGELKQDLENRKMAYPID